MPHQTVSALVLIEPCVDIWLEGCVSMYVYVCSTQRPVSVHRLADCTFAFVYPCLLLVLPRCVPHSSLEEHAVRCALSSPPEVARRAVRCIGKLTIRNMSMEKRFEVCWAGIHML